MDFILTCFPHPATSPQTLMLIYKAKDKPPTYLTNQTALYHVPSTLHPVGCKEDIHQDFFLCTKLSLDERDAQ